MSKIALIIFIILFSSACKSACKDRKYPNYKILSKEPIEISVINQLQSLRLVEVNHTNLLVILNLAQAYEAEFSALTGKIPNDNGEFVFDTIPVAPYQGYLLYQANTPIGFCVINTNSTPQDIAEFYIIPSRRHKKIGTEFAYSIFDKYPGLWQVRQIKGAEHAIAFWRRVISTYTKNNYKEQIIEDPDWGIVTKQIFTAAKK